jgi:FkbM family methyltransferase
MHWINHSIVRQLPLSYRLWGHYLRLAPIRSGGGALAGSALFRLLRAFARVRRRAHDGLLTIHESAAPYSLTIDLLDFESFNHTLDLWLRGCDESRMLKALFALGDVFVDIGANLGLFSLQASSLGGAQSRVYSFEPQPRAAAALRSSAASNGLDTITVVEMVVGASEGDVPFFIPFSGSGVGSLSRVHASQASGALEVIRQSTSLDVYFSSVAVDRVDLIKIDVEGFEGDVLKGAKETLRRFSPNIWFEINPAALQTAGRSQGECISLLESCGYRTFFDIATLWSRAPQTVSGDVDNLTNVIAVPASRLETFLSLFERPSA